MYKFLDRIVVHPKILSGKPIIKGTRIPIYVVLQMLRDGASFDDIIRGYPRLTVEDIKAVLEYTLYLVGIDHEDIIPLSERS